jgi:hypothetical protein
MAANSTLMSGQYQTRRKRRDQDRDRHQPMRTQTNLRDERFLPFEGGGAVSTWKLDLPNDYRTFDYDTISDVILQIRYTARQGVEPTKVKAALDDIFQQANQAGLTLLLSLHHDFSPEWSAFVNGNANFKASIPADPAQCGWQSGQLGCGNSRPAGQKQAGMSRDQRRC